MRAGLTGRGIARRNVLAGHDVHLRRVLLRITGRWAPGVIGCVGAAGLCGVGGRFGITLLRREQPS